MKRVLLVLFSLVSLLAHTGEVEPPADKPKRVYVIPIREDIMPPLTFLVRRGIKEAMDQKADLLILDMDTHGGRVDVTEEIIGIISKFKGPTVTYVNNKAFSAGAFISIATKKIYMAPQSVIGAAAPIMISPVPGSGVENMPDTLEVKTVSGIKALMRVHAEKNGYNAEIVEAMIDKTKEVSIDGEVINSKGSILTLTDQQARKEYGNPPKPLLSSGTVETLPALIQELGYKGAEVKHVQPTGAEKLAIWINAISPLLLVIGIIGVYLEFKTPGFGLPGIVGLVAFAFYFFGGYIAGLSGLEWMVIFLLGLVLIILELFVFPGTIMLGLAGAGFVLIALFMALADVYPGVPGDGWLPTFSWTAVRKPVQVMGLALAGSLVAVVLLSRWLPKTPMYQVLVSTAASGSSADLAIEQRQVNRLGLEGVTVSPLRPGGKAQFGTEIFDVISQGEMIPKGQKVKVIGHSGSEAIVEPV